MTSSDYDKLTNLISDSLDRTAFVIERQLDGLSHEDCLLQLPFRGNCANWVLGHIVSSRSAMLHAINNKAYWGEEENALYQFGSEPITDGEKALSLEQLRAHLNASAENLKTAVKQASREQMEKIWNEERQSTVLDFLLFMVWHESYHAGHLEYLRQLAGKDDKVI